MAHAPVYLDYHATTPVDPRVLREMLPFFSETFGNPASSSHPWGWKAQEAVEKARRDALLHRAKCSFEKKPGGIYHLYRKTDGELWFSRLAPSEWVTPQPQTFEGSFRLELDMSFSRLDAEGTNGSPPILTVDAILGTGSDEPSR